MNWLQPPFNDVKVRQAAAYALSQPEFLEANIGDKRFYRTCKAMFTCDTPLASTAGMDGLIEGNVAKAKELLAEAEYDGTPVVMPQPTDLGVIKQIAPVAKAQLEKAGFKVEVQPMDWQSMVTRLITKKGPPSEGGWNAFGTSWSQVDILDPLMTPNLDRDLREGARRLAVRRRSWRSCATTSSRPTTPAEKKAAAERCRRCAMQIVTHVPLGEWFGVGAARDNIEFPPVLPPVTVFWGISEEMTERSVIAEALGFASG